VTSPGQVAGATQDAAGQTASTAKDQAAQVGSTATSAAADVAGTTKQQAGAVAGEAVSQVRGLLDQTRSQVSEQAGGAQQKLGESLRSLSDELRSMGDGSGSGSGPAAELARTLADRGAMVADYVAAKQPGELLQDLRSLAARRPGGFLLGALAAGVLAGRITRGATAGSSGPSTPAPALDVAPAQDFAPIAYQTAEPDLGVPVLGATAAPVVPGRIDDTVDDDVTVRTTSTFTGAAEPAYPDDTAVTTTTPYGTGRGL
jgi:uncharacterized protein YjbJ (UPF0337 family)